MHIAHWEGISYLTLLLVAMPLKYVWGFALAVKIVGWVHGILFIAYMLLAFQNAKAYRWSWFFSATVVAASLIPLGTFWLNKKLRNT